MPQQHQHQHQHQRYQPHEEHQTPPLYIVEGVVVLPLHLQQRRQVSQQREEDEPFFQTTKECPHLKSGKKRGTSTNPLSGFVSIVFMTAVLYSFLSWSFVTFESSTMLSHDHVHEGEQFLTHYMATASQQPPPKSDTSSKDHTTLVLRNNDLEFQHDVKALPSILLNDVDVLKHLRYPSAKVKTSDTTFVTIQRQQLDTDTFCIHVNDVDNQCDLSSQEAYQRIIKHAFTNTRGNNRTASSLPSLRMEPVIPGAIEYHWWLVDGHPVLVSSSCGNGKDAYFNTNFHPLSVLSSSFSSSSSACSAEDLAAPLPSRAIRDRMVSVVMHAFPHDMTMPSTITRLTLHHVYAEPTNGPVLYVSTLVHSSNSMASGLPPVLRSLLEGALEGHLVPALLSPHHVERIVNDKTWVLSKSKFPQFTIHANASDLCQEMQHRNTLDSNPNNLQCRPDDFVSLQEDFPIHCVGLNSKTHKVFAVGQWRLPTFETVIVRVDWPWAMGLILVIMVLCMTGWETTLSRQRHAIPLTIFLYLAIVVLYKYKQPNSAGLFSPESIYTTIVDSFHAFTVVHPMTSPWIAVSHVLTYWFEVAAWRAKSIRGVLLWYLAYELIASYVNEYMHITEEDNAVRCLRVSFIYNMKQFAVDDVIRAYLLPPFFVYLYLTPRLCLEWVMNFGGMIASPSSV